MLYGKLQADGSSTEFPKCDLDYDAVLRILDDAFFLMTEVCFHIIFICFCYAFSSPNNIFQLVSENIAYQTKGIWKEIYREECANIHKMVIESSKMGLG